MRGKDVRGLLVDANRVVVGVKIAKMALFIVTGYNC